MKESNRKHKLVSTLESRGHTREQVEWQMSGLPPRSQRFLGTLWTALLLSITSFAHADDIVPEDRMKAIGAYIWSPEALKTPLRDRPSRMQFAKLIGQVCGDYRNAVPTVTPDEQKWLETELSQTGKRLEGAAASPIYARYSLANTFDRCVEAANGIAQGDDRASMWIWLSTIMIEDDVFDTFGQFGVNGVGNQDIGIVNSLMRRIAMAIMVRVIRPQVE